MLQCDLTCQDSFHGSPFPLRTWQRSEEAGVVRRLTEGCVHARTYFMFWDLFADVCLSDQEVAELQNPYLVWKSFEPNRFRSTLLELCVLRLQFSRFRLYFRTLVHLDNAWKYRWYKVHVQWLFWFWHFIKTLRNTVRSKLLFGTTMVLKVRVTLCLTCAQQQTDTTAVLTAVFSTLWKS